MWVFGERGHGEEWAAQDEPVRPVHGVAAEGSAGTARSSPSCSSFPFHTSWGSSKGSSKGSSG